MHPLDRGVLHSLLVTLPGVESALRGAFFFEIDHLFEDRLDVSNAALSPE